MNAFSKIEHTPPPASIYEGNGFRIRVKRTKDGKRFGIRVTREAEGEGYSWIGLKPEEADNLITCLIEQLR